MTHRTSLPITALAVAVHFSAAFVIVTEALCLAALPRMLRRRQAIRRRSHRHSTRRLPKSCARSSFGQRREFDEYRAYTRKPGVKEAAH